MFRAKKIFSVYLYCSHIFVSFSRFSFVITLVILHNHGICVTGQTIYPLHYVIETRQIVILAFCFSLKRFRTSSHAGVRYSNSSIRGLVSTALCVSQSRCTTQPFRFMQIAELGEMHTSVRVGDSRSFVSVKSARVLQAWRFRRTPED